MIPVIGTFFPSVATSMPTPETSFKKDRIPDSHAPSRTLACLIIAPCSKTRPKIMIRIRERDDGF